MDDPEHDLVKKACLSADRAQAGDKDAFGKIFDKYALYVYKLALWTLGQFTPSAKEDAQEIEQEVFLSLMRNNFKKLKSFKSKSKFSTWLAAVTINTTLNYIEKQRRYREKLTKLESDRYVSLYEPLENLSKEEVSKNVRDAIRHLPARDRLLLELFYIDGLSYSQIAKLLNYAEGSVSPLLMRARQRLLCILNQAKSV